MEATKDTVYIVDDSHASSEVLEFLRTKERAVHLFTEMTEFLNYRREDSRSCLIVFRRASETERGIQRLISSSLIPVILVTGRGDTSSAVSAMKAGAADVLTKPIRQDAFLRSVERALDIDAMNRVEAEELAALSNRYESLTPREREILPLLTNGLLNKQAAFELGITEYTVQIHRGHIMRKMEADSFAALVKIATKLKLDSMAIEQSSRNG